MRKTLSRVGQIEAFALFAARHSRDEWECLVVGPNNKDVNLPLVIERYQCNFFCRTCQCDCRL